MSYFFQIPFSKINEANALAVQIAGVPAFSEERARGTTRADAFAYSHGVLGTHEQNEEFAVALATIGGVATKTYDRAKKLREPVDEMLSLGEQKRPDLPLKTTAKLVALALELGITPTPKEREALIDLLEQKMTETANVVP